MPDFKYRSDTKELLDGNDIPFDDIKRNMIELDIINTRLGGHAISIDGLKQLLRPGDQEPEKSLHICEIGCGGGDNLRVLKRWMEAHNRKAIYTGVDINAECISFARQQTHNEGISFVHADYRRVLFDHQPDILFTSLFCHHFTDPELVNMVRWLYDQSSLGFFINDLHRHPLAFYSIKGLTQLFSRSYLVKNDAPLSVRRGFVRKEWESIIKQGGLINFRIQWKWAFRWLITCYHD